VTLLAFSALLAAVAGVWVIRPLWVRRAAILADAASGELLDAEARRRASLAALKDLEYDWLGGKLDAADYKAQRDRLSLEALAAIRAAESAQSAARAVGEAGSVGEPPHGCGFVNPGGSRFCAGCGARLR
jgi:hypothetical protein